MQNHPETGKTSKKRNLIVILALLGAALLLFALSRLLPSPAAQPPDAENTSEAYLFIILNNRVWGVEPLGEEREVTVDQGNGVVNVIHLLPNGYYMASSTCENQLCITEGTVTLDNYQRRFLGACVYCLPHNLQLELVVPGATKAPDAPDN